MNKYILDGKTPVLCGDLLTWAKWFEGANRTCKKEMIGDVTVSTIFLGIDHSFGDGDPILFETMIFGGEHDQEEWRYSTWDGAVRGHIAAVDLVKGKS